MKVVGIVCEYNPFHNGHRYQMEQARSMSGADAVVCVMSGNYVQRGEMAAADKWVRTGMALASGADLVIELPTLYALSGAQSFARAGVKLLLNAGADALSFGCESENLELLRKIALILKEEPESYRHMLKEGLDQGESFARARASAMGQYLASEEAVWMLDQPGAILGTEYLAALSLYGAAEKEVVLVKRQGGEHRDVKRQDRYASASAIRKALKEGRFLEEAMPASASALWRAACSQGRTMPEELFLTQRLYGIIAEDGEGRLRQTPEIGEGLENRVLQKAEYFLPWEELIGSIVCKRYPASRIRRGLMNLCLGITQETRSRVNWDEGPAYMRILGIGARGEEILHRIKQEGNLPILTNPGGQLEGLSGAARCMFREEVKYTDLYTLALPGAGWYHREREYREKIVKNKEKKR